MREALPTTAVVMRKRFGLFVRDRREDLGMTQAEVARRLGVDNNMVSQVERGQTALPTHNLGAWADVLRTPRHELAERFAYFMLPGVYRCLFDADPYAIEELPRPHLTARSAPGRPAAGRGR